MKRGLACRQCVEGDAFEARLVPPTPTVASWGERKPADRVNIKVDQMVRYAARLIETGRGAG